MKFLYKWWMKFVKKLGKINGYIILTLVYFSVFFLYFIFNLFVIIFSKKEKSRDSFWKEKASSEINMENLKYQF